MLKTLNVSDSDWTVPYPHVGTIGKHVAFEPSLELAQRYGFDAVNLDVDYLQQHGADRVRQLLHEHGLRPGGFRFPVKITDEGDEELFRKGLAQFEKEAPLCAAAGYRVCAMHILPWSFTGRMPFGEHFRLTVSRLQQVLPLLRQHDIHLGLEFLGSFGNRRGAAHDFIHTVEGVRCLAAAAGAESHVGLKLDVHHCWAVNDGLDELVTLQPRDIAYVELNDSMSDGQVQPTCFL